MANFESADFINIEKFDKLLVCRTFSIRSDYKNKLCEWNFRKQAKGVMR